MTGVSIELTDQQATVARLVGDGYSNKQIAAQIGRKPARVEQLIAEIRDAWQLDRSRNLRTQIARHVAAHPASSGRE